jgi:hypothetical protein
VQTISDCVFGIVCAEDLVGISRVDPTLLPLLRTGLLNVFLESLRDSIPLLWSVTLCFSACHIHTSLCFCMLHIRTLLKALTDSPVRIPSAGVASCCDVSCCEGISACQKSPTSPNALD